MRIMIASDIHGSAYYCNELVNAYKRESPEKFLLLGDILYHGPRNDLPRDYDPKIVAKLLNDLNRESGILCVRGNCDSEVDQMMLEFPIMSEYCILYVNGRTIFATHGHVFNTSNIPPISSGDILLHGHTHVPAWENFGENCAYLNPGSVSIPKSNSPNSYMILNDGSFAWKELDGKIYHEHRV